MKRIRETLLELGNVNEMRLRVLQNGIGSITFPLNHRPVCLDDIRGFSFKGLTESSFETVVSDLLKGKAIQLTADDVDPLNIQGLDDYFARFGDRVVENLDDQIHSLVELRPNVKNLALKKKSLFPQQAASIEGVLAMERNGLKYAVLNHGMGCGKTLEAASVVEACMVEKWLKKHPDKTLKDAYSDKENVRYRAIVMPPGHLVQKWAEEVEKEIPYAKGIVVESLSQLIELKESGSDPIGKEFYIISKDFCKLDTQLSPIPTQIKKRYYSQSICSDCYKEDGMVICKKGIGSEARCPSCYGNNFEPYALKHLGTFRGLICPSCGELLIKYKRYNMDDDHDCGADVLTPVDFAHPKTDNSQCYHCGAPLWGANAKPLISSGKTPKEPKWYKVSHAKNHTHKTTETSFVLKGHEDEYYRTCITTHGLKKSTSAYGPRKVAPSRYIKKYLKGFFDFCILDEFHKYLGESAQGVAAHALSKASRFTIALTGTISNGTAECFYNLFWMLEPIRMLNLGYRYSSNEKMRFCKEFGCVETVYEAREGVKNVTSRGKQLSSPSIKPGISPVLFGKLLIDRCLFLDISDLSKYLPKLKERIMLVDPPSSIKRSYNLTIDMLREAAHGRTGMAALSASLQFGLSYMDKPYGRKPIMDPYNADAILCNIENFEEYAEPTMLLPKEEKLIELVKQEISEGRGVFVYATFTGKAETNISYRLKELIERNCNLKGRVEILESTSPAAKQREQWFHRRASEGIKVFITNPANVETGLDFCFEHEGVKYNYPTLIFYQIGYSLTTMWQAARRAYRLNQTEECRTFYLAYNGTLQTAALEIMAKKQVATAAIQGHFSAEGLSSMAKGVDARAELARALSENDMSSQDTLENMFDALEAMNSDVSEDKEYVCFKPSPTFWQLLGYTEACEDIQKEVFEPSFENLLDSFNDSWMPSTTTSKATAEHKPAVSAKETTKKETTEFSHGLFDEFLAFFEEPAAVSKPIAPKKTKKTKNNNTNSCAPSIFDLWDIA
jgi:hypothetical protein